MAITKEMFKQELGKLTENCAYVKCDGNEIEYIRIDNKKFDNPDTMAKDIIEYTEKMKQASDMAMLYNSVDEIGKYIDHFIIKYHPSWMYARAAAGLIEFENGEEACIHPNLVKTFDRWYHDYFLAAGVEPLEKPNIKPNISMTLSVFESIFFGEEGKKEKKFEAKYHKDHNAFYHTLSYINSIDEYYKQTNAGKIPKKNLNGAKYKLSNDGFPIIVIDYKEYDFRRDSQEENCYKKIYKKSTKQRSHPQLVFNRKARRKF